MDTYTPPQVRGTRVTSNTTTQLRPSPWNKPTETTNSTPPSHAPRYALTSIMPVTPSKAQSWRVVGSPPTPVEVLSSPGVASEVPPSVKHLTCYFWNAHGKCKHSDEDCLYAHYHTGQVADPPVQVEPGRPAVAGRNAMNAHAFYGPRRDQHGNYGMGPIMPPVMHGPIYNPKENFDNMIRAQNVHSDGQFQNTHDQFSNGQREQSPFPPNAIRQSNDHHPHGKSSASDIGYERVTGNLCTLAGDLYSVVDKSHDTFAQAVVTLHAQCEALLKQAQNLYREADPKPKASIETLVGAVSAMMPLIDQQKRMAAETEDAKHGIIQSMNGAGLGYMARSWQAPPSTSGGTL